jgi:hypothetical protein
MPTPKKKKKKNPSIKPNPLLSIGCVIKDLNKSKK